MDDKAQLNTLIQYRLVEALSVAESRYRQLLDSLSEVVFTLDDSDCFTILNLAWQNHTGHSPSACLGRDLRQFLPEAEFLRWKSLQQAGSFRADFQFFDSHHRPKWFNVNFNQHATGSYGTMLCIDEHKRSTQALEYSEQQFRNVVESLAEILFQVDHNLTLLFLNPAWERVTGFCMTAALGRSLLDFIYPQDREAVAQGFSSTLSGLPSQLELRIACQDGHYKWMSIKLQQINHAPGIITGAMLDIHHRKLVEESLRISEERYAILASSTTDGVWDWDLNTDQVFYSPRWKEMLGFRDDELENVLSSWSGRVHPEDLQQAMSDVMECLEGNKAVYENIHRMRHRQGHWVWILDRGTVLRDAKGVPYRMIGSHADISLLKSTEASLQNREKILEAIVNICPDGIITISQLGTLQTVNPAVCEMLGLSDEYLTGLTEWQFEQLLQQLSTAHPSYLSAGNGEAVSYCLDLSKLRNHPAYSQELYANKAGKQSSSPKLKVLTRTVRPVQNDQISKILYFRDISIESEVDQMKSHFLSTAAHELRTPMASVFGFSELLLSREFDRATRNEMVETIHQQSKCLVSMLNQLLDLARIESRMGMDFCFEVQPLLPIVQRTLNDFLMPCDNRQAALHPANREFWVEVDAEKLRQVITNVLSNAYKYSPNGGEIEVYLIEKNPDSPAHGQVGIAIRDHGLGMTAEQISHIFERFWRADPSLAISGTGLGMCLVKEIMDIHRGQVTIQSKLGEGTTVTLWLEKVPVS